MQTEPDDLDRAELARVLGRHWGLSGALEYAPVGFGSHHWRTDDVFVSVDVLDAGFQAGPDVDASFAALERAFRTAAALRDDGLEFVVAPLPDDEGNVVRRLAARYAVRVTPYVEGVSKPWGEYESPDERRAVAALLGRLHTATVDADLPRRDDFAVPARASLFEALDELSRPWSSGPFAERVRRLLAPHADELVRRFAEYDALARRVRERRSAWVVTHGEPHRANVVRDRGGAFHLIDWDTTLLAPRERDLRMVLDDDRTGWAEYIAQAGSVTLDEDALELYRRWWDLADIATFTDLLRRPHEHTEDTLASFNALAGYLRVE